MMMGRVQGTERKLVEMIAKNIFLMPSNLCDKSESPISIAIAMRRLVRGRSATYRRFDFVNFCCDLRLQDDMTTQ